jgi:hypothetical protein
MAEYFGYDCVPLSFIDILRSAIYEYGIEHEFENEVRIQNVYITSI